MEKERCHLFSGSSSPVSKSSSDERSALVGYKRRREESYLSRVSRHSPCSLSETLAECRLATRENKSIYLNVKVRVEGKSGGYPYSWSVAGDLAAGEKEIRVMRFPPPPSDNPVSSYCFFGKGSCIFALGGQKSASLTAKRCREIFYFNARSPREGWKRLPVFSSPRWDPFVFTTEDGTMYAMGQGVYPGQSFAEVLKPDSYQWKPLPQLPPELSKVSFVTMHAVFDFGRRILLYSPLLKAAFTYDVMQNSWALLDAGFGTWWGEAAVDDCVMFCFGNLDEHPYCNYSVQAYDLNKLKWFPRPVRGLKGKGVLPPLAYFASRGLLCRINFVRLVRIYSGRLCLIWVKKICDNGRVQLKVHCTQFTIHKHFSKSKLETHFYARNLSSADYVVDGYSILSCMLMESLLQEEEDTIKEGKKNKNEGHEGKTSGIKRQS